MKKLFAITIMIIIFTGCADNSLPIIDVNDIEEVTKIKSFEHMYLTRMSFTKDWVVWININLEGNEIKIEGRDKNLQKALTEAIKKSSAISECIPKDL